MKNQETPGMYVLGLVVVCGIVAVLVVGLVGRKDDATQQQTQQQIVTVTNAGQPVVPAGYRPDTNNLVTVTGSARAGFAE